jgi:hypothetical protein
MDTAVGLQGQQVVAQKVAMQLPGLLSYRTGSCEAAARFVVSCQRLSAAWGGDVWEVWGCQVWGCDVKEVKDRDV